MHLNPQFDGSERVAFRPATPSDVIEGVACVKEWTPKTARNGSAYVRVTLANRTGQASLTLFESQLPGWTGIEVGDAVRVTLVGRPGSGGYGPSWDCAQVRRLDASHPVRLDLLPPCPIPYEELCTRWDALVQRLSPEALALLQVVLRDVGEEAYRAAPAAKGMHHAVAPYGLWWHSMEVAEFALGLIEARPDYRELVWIDLLIVGALLHDVGKIMEYRAEPGVGISMTPISASRYHTTLGIQLVTAAVTRFAMELEQAGTPAALVDGVLAIIESHHAQKEYGSPSAPNSAEAWLVHAADLVSANLCKTRDLVATATPTSEATWYRTANGRPDHLQVFRDVARQMTRRVVDAGADAGGAPMPASTPNPSLGAVPHESAAPQRSPETADDQGDWITITIDPEAK